MAYSFAWSRSLSNEKQLLHCRLVGIKACHSIEYSAFDSVQPANAHVKSAEVFLYVKTAWAKRPHIPRTLRDIPSNPNHNFSTMPAKRWCCHTKPPHFSALTHYIIDLWNETVTVSCPGPSQPSPDKKNLNLRNACVNMCTTAANHSQASQAIHSVSLTLRSSR